MKPWRIMAWAGITLAVLFHLVAGIVGPDARLCICSAGVMVERQIDACCGIQAGNADPRPAMPAPCDTDCLLIPLPDVSIATLGHVPPVPEAIALPPVTVFTWITWPLPDPSIVRSPKVPLHPPDPARHHLRSVVLTC
jgi:hypothetical protein